MRLAQARRGHGDRVQNRLETREPGADCALPGGWVDQGEVTGAQSPRAPWARAVKDDRTLKDCPR